MEACTKKLLYLCSRLFERRPNAYGKCIGLYQKTNLSAVTVAIQATVFINLH